MWKIYRASVSFGRDVECISKKSFFKKNPKFQVVCSNMRICCKAVSWLLRQEACCYLRRIDVSSIKPVNCCLSAFHAWINQLLASRYQIHVCCFPANRECAQAQILHPAHEVMATNIWATGGFACLAPAKALLLLLWLCTYLLWSNNLGEKAKHFSYCIFEPIVNNMFNKIFMVKVENPVLEIHQDWWSCQEMSHCFQDNLSGVITELFWLFLCLFMFDLFFILISLQISYSRTAK